MKEIVASYNYCGRNDGDDDDEKGKALKRIKLAASSHLFFFSFIFVYCEFDEIGGNFYFCFSFFFPHHRLTIRKTTIFMIDQSHRHCHFEKHAPKLW